MLPSSIGNILRPNDPGAIGTSYTTAATTVGGNAAPPSNLALTPASVSDLWTSADITKDQTPVVTGSAAPGATVTLHDGATVVGTGVANPTTGSWSIETSSLANGVHALTATAVNGTGVISANSAPLDMTVESQAPVVAITSAGGLVNSQTQTITGTMDIADAGDVVTILEGSTVLGTAQPNSVTGAWSASVTLSNIGSNAVTASATDPADNVGTSAPVSFMVDTQPPTVSIATAGGTPVRRRRPSPARWRRRRPRRDRR